MGDTSHNIIIVMGGFIILEIISVVVLGLELIGNGGCGSISLRIIWE